MNLVPLLALPVVGGYALFSTWTITRYHSSRESGHRLYFRSVLYGVFLVIWAVELHVILYQLDAYQEILEILRLLSGETKLNSLWGTASVMSILFLSFLLGPVIGHILNVPRIAFLRKDWGDGIVGRIEDLIPDWVMQSCKNWEDYWLDHAIKNNDFEKLVARSVRQSKPMMLTLGTGKVYVGWALHAPNPAHERRAIRIFPLLSGYRDQNDQTVSLPTDYFQAYDAMESEESPEHIESEDFEIVLPTDQIVSAHLFDPFIYYSVYEERGAVEE